MGGLLHWLRHPRRCYLVCATARSGSNLLTDGLHATRRAGRPKQFFLPKFQDEYAAQHGLDAKADFAGYLRGVVAKTATSNEVFGFKVMGWQLEEFLGQMRSAGAFGGRNEREMLLNAFPRLQCVQIIRENRLRQAISKARALQSGLWKVQEGNEALAEPRFDADLIRRCIEDNQKDEETWRAFFQRNGFEPLVVFYEDLCADYSAVILRVLDFLCIRLPKGVEIPAARTVRQSDELSREWEERYLALKPAAAG